MATLIIEDETLRNLRQAAAALGIPLEAYLAQVAAAATRNGKNRAASLVQGSPEWIRAFDGWVGSHPRRGFIADDSRDAIYGDERD